MKQYKITKPIRLIELFAGIGSQAKALERLGIDFEHYKVCEFDKYAIKSYNAIHGTNFETSDITQIHASDLQIVDTDKFEYIMTYSFPCQDLSIAGKQAGMDKNSGTRSGLLWEVERLLDECDELPQILLMENVSGVHSKKHIDNFNKWCDFLKSKGYTNYWKDLNAKDFGIPQSRNRCFVVSFLDNRNFEFPKPFELKTRFKDILEREVEEKYYLNKPWHFITDEEVKYEANEIAQLDNTNYKAIRSITDVNKICRCLDTMGGGQREPKIIVVAKTENNFDKEARIYDTKGLSPTLEYRDYKGAKKILETHTRVRRVTPKECWRLMGFDDEDFEKAQQVNSNTQLYKQAGNSIVVNVLEKIFNQML